MQNLQIQVDGMARLVEIFTSSDKTIYYARLNIGLQSVARKADYGPNPEQVRIHELDNAPRSASSEVDLPITKREYEALRELLENAEPRNSGHTSKPTLKVGGKLEVAIDTQYYKIPRAKDTTRKR